MEDGVSVFDKAVKLPPVCNPFTVIPKRHLDWFKAVFMKGERSIPPLPDSSAPIAVPAAMITIQGTDAFGVQEINNYGSNVLFTVVHLGVFYALTKSHAYREEIKVAPIPTSKRSLLCFADDGTPVLTISNGSGKYFSTQALDGTEVGTLSGDGVFVRNNAIYAACSGRLMESTFKRMGSKVLHTVKAVGNLSSTTSKVFEGCVIQDLLGKKYITIPYAAGRSCTKAIPELDTFRVLEAKSEKNIVVVVGEKGGDYTRFVLTFDKLHAAYTLRNVPGVSYDTINFTVSDSGVCVLLASPTEVEMTAQDGVIRMFNNPPFDSTMNLFSTPRGVFFNSDGTVFKLSIVV